MYMDVHKDMTGHRSPFFFFFWLIVVIDLSKIVGAVLDFRNPVTQFCDLYVGGAFQAQAPLYRAQFRTLVRRADLPPREPHITMEFQLS